MQDVNSMEMTIPEVPAAIRQKVVRAMKISELVILETLSGTTYTETVVEEKTLSYEDAVAIITRLEDEKLISKEG